MEELIKSLLSFSSQPLTATKLKKILSLEENFSKKYKEVNISNPLSIFSCEDDPGRFKPATDAIPEKSPRILDAVEFVDAAANMASLLYLSDIRKEPKKIIIERMKVKTLINILCSHNMVSVSERVTTFFSCNLLSSFITNYFGTQGRT